VQRFPKEFVMATIAKTGRSVPDLEHDAQIFEYSKVADPISSGTTPGFPIRYSKLIFIQVAPVASFHSILAAG
jgi:hypothetical protein